MIVEYTERGADEVALPGGGTATAPTRIEEGVRIRLSPDETAGDGVAIAKVSSDSAGWALDPSFEPARCR